MDFKKLAPIQTTRIDPTSGKEYTFRVVPPVDLLETGWNELGEPKEFVIGFFWRVLSGDWDVFNFDPNLLQKVEAVFPILKEIVTAININRVAKDEASPIPDEASSTDNQYIYSYSFTVGVDNERIDPPSTELVSILNKEVLTSTAIQLAMLWYTNSNKEAIDAKFDKLNRRTTEGVDSKRLFPNSKAINLDLEYGFPRFIGDNWNRGIRNVDRIEIANQYEKSNNIARDRRTAFKIRNKGGSETEFLFDKEKLAIKTVNDLCDQVERLKDAKVIKTLSALLKLANQQDSAVFHDMSISTLMSLVLNEKTFNTPTRREFSKVLEFIAAISITVNAIGERVKNGKSKTELKEIRDIKLFHMNPSYSVKREFQTIPKERLLPEHFDKSVITHFSGTILPGQDQMFSKAPAMVFFDSLLHLDANKDSSAIILGFHVQTRFHQLMEEKGKAEKKERVMRLDRAFLIDLCGYVKTNQTKPSKATLQLRKTLDKLVKANIISEYSGLTNNDADKVTIYPPITRSRKMLN